MLFSLVLVFSFSGSDLPTSVQTSDYLGVLVILHRVGVRTAKKHGLF